MSGPGPLSLEEIHQRCERLLAHSPADFTSVAWMELRRGRIVSHDHDRGGPSPFERTVVFQIEERGRPGFFRTDAAEPGELATGLRQALAVARGTPVLAVPALRPPAGETLPALVEPLFDPAVADLADHPDGLDLTGLTNLGETAVGNWTFPRLDRRESAQLDWRLAVVAVANSSGLWRAAEVTAVGLEVACGRRPGAGRAAGSSRSLSRLPCAEILQRARDRHALPGTVDLPNQPCPAVLAPEAAAALVDLLGRWAFSGRAYSEGSSLLVGRLGEPIFDATLELIDDATDSAGLPFPFDFEGLPKRSVTLIHQGRPLTPTLDLRLAAATGLAATGHSAAGDDALPENLLLAPGSESEAELRRRAEGGLWIGSLERIACLDPRVLAFRAIARGVRRIGADGALESAVPDLIWETAVPSLLARQVTLGSDRICWARGEGILGGITVPALALGALSGFRPAP